ncbi:MAG: hypothetical protein IPP64_10845 [Bacteroidetes bacterium]|nr:hypothetical protein [Bacteroidota bacterium]
MKYKRLDSSELKALENEFIHFLASAQITGSDWEKMKLEELSKAEELLDVFSDLVYEKVMNKIEFLEYRDNKSLNLFRFAEDKIVLLGIRVKENSKLDLMADGVFDQWKNSDSDAVNLVRSEKQYRGEKGVEVFELLQTGCFITDGKLFNLLQQL